MDDWIANLAKQAMDSAPEVRPLLPSRFASWPGMLLDSAPPPSPELEGTGQAASAARFPPPLIDPNRPDVDAPLLTLRQMSQSGLASLSPLQPHLLSEGQAPGTGAGIEQDASGLQGSLPAGEPAGGALPGAPFAAPQAATPVPGQQASLPAPPPATRTRPGAADAPPRPGSQRERGGGDAHDATSVSPAPVPPQPASAPGAGQPATVDPRQASPGAPSTVSALAPSQAMSQRAVASNKDAAVQQDRAASPPLPAPLAEPGRGAVPVRPTVSATDAVIQRQVEPGAALLPEAAAPATVSPAEPAQGIEAQDAADNTVHVAVPDRAASGRGSQGDAAPLTPRAAPPAVDPLPAPPAVPGPATVHQRQALPQQADLPPTTPPQVTGRQAGDGNGDAAFGDVDADFQESRAAGTRLPPFAREPALVAASLAAPSPVPPAVGPEPGAILRPQGLPEGDLPPAAIASGVVSPSVPPRATEQPPAPGDIGTAAGRDHAAVQESQVLEQPLAPLVRVPLAEHPTVPAAASGPGAVLQRQATSGAATAPPAMIQGPALAATSTAEPFPVQPAVEPQPDATLRPRVPLGVDPLPTAVTSGEGAPTQERRVSPTAPVSRAPVPPQERGPEQARAPAQERLVSLTAPVSYMQFN